MAKRFISTDLFNEDWFLELDLEVRLFYVYAFLTCDHAGILRANLRPFNALNGTTLSADTILEQINAERPRIKKLTDRAWLLTGFISFQYGNELNPANRVHASVLKILEENNIDLSEIKGLTRGLLGVKDKEKDMDKENADTLHFTGASEIPESAEVVAAFRSTFNVNGYPPDAFGGAEQMGLDFLNHYSSQGWRKGNGMPIHKWLPMVPKWFATERARQTKNTKTTIITQPKRSWEN